MIRKVLFRIIGTLSMLGGIFALYYYGSELLPLYTRFLGGDHDLAETITIFALFLFGAPSLLWMGTRLVALRSFANTCVSYAILPIIAWGEELYNFGQIGTLERISAFSPVFIGVYVPTLIVFRYIHATWYTPISHDGDRQVRLEQPSTSALFEFKWAIVIVVLLAFIIFNPTDALRILDRGIDAVMYAWNWVHG